MLCYVIWLFVKRLSQEAIQRRSQRDRLVKIKVFKLRRDADDIPCNITLRSAGGESFHSVGPTTAKARFWDREVRDQGIRRSQRSAERSGRVVNVLWPCIKYFTLQGREESEKMWQFAKGVGSEDHA